jgi:hypothetical protein
MLGFTVYRVKGHTCTRANYCFSRRWANGGLYNINWSYGKNHLLNPARCKRSVISVVASKTKGMLRERPLQNGGFPLLCLPSHWNGLFLTQRPRISRSEDVIARNVRSSLLEMAPPVVCRCIQDSEPIEIGEALGVEWFHIAPVLLTARANHALITGRFLVLETIDEFPGYSRTDAQVFFAFQCIISLAHARGVDGTSPPPHLN